MAHPGLDRVRADALARGLTLDIVTRPEADSLESAAALLGIGPDELVKSLVVKRHDGDYIFVLVPGDRQISWAKLRTVVGVNKLSMPHEDLAFEATGYARGTITPLGSATAWPVYADERMIGRRIAMGAGEHGHSVFVDADALIATYNAIVADVTDPLKPRR